jgi:hypothetical protein
MSTERANVWEPIVLPPFRDGERRCPKCGLFREPEVRYIPASQYRVGPPPLDARLECKCHRCGYTWDEAPLDEAKETTEDADTEPEADAVTDALCDRDDQTVEEILAAYHGGHGRTYLRMIYRVNAIERSRLIKEWHEEHGTRP